MSAIEWNSVDGNGVSLPTIVSNSDLFEGELFGDELIDIYNSAAAEDHNVSNEIPPILSHSTEGNQNMESVEAVQIAAAAAAMDDGLGAFRPSTSFSDLTTLLNPSGEAASSGAKAGESKFSATVTTKTSKKRSSSAIPSNQPPSKKKATVPKVVRRVSGSVKKPVASAAEAQSVKAPSAKATPTKAPSAKSDNHKPANTPDPLDKPKASSGTAKIVKAPAPTAKPDTANSSDFDPMDDCFSKADSDEDYQTLAQVAVSNLMTGAASSKADEQSFSTSRKSSSEKVDISTEHVKALTGNNWVAACPEITAAAVPTPVPSADKGDPNNRARRQNLTADERARQNRDRNREHARNTRLRKKAYVEELKRALTELVNQRDAAELEKRQSAQRELEQREVRFRVLEEFLKLRGRNESNSARWAAILENGFTFTVPSIDYESGGSSGETLLRGVTSIMAESAAFNGFLKKIGTTSGPGVASVQFVCDRKNFFMDDCNAFLEWTASSVVPGNENSATGRLSLKGMIRGKFSPASNKLITATMTFNTADLTTRRGKAVSRTVNAVDDIAAAKAADAILDSLEMPHIAVHPSTVPSAVNVVHSSCSSSEETSEKYDAESDESVSEEKNSSTIINHHAVKCDT